MNKYLAFYNSVQLAIAAPTSYEAQKKAAEILKVSFLKRYEITIILVEDADGNSKSVNTASL